MFFKRKKIERDELDKAFDLGLITKEEVLRLRIDRAKEDFKNFVKKTKKIKRK